MNTGKEIKTAEEILYEVNMTPKDYEKEQSKIEKAISYIKY